MENLDWEFHPKILTLIEGDTNKIENFVQIE